MRLAGRESLILLLFKDAKKNSVMKRSILFFSVFISFFLMSFSPIGNGGNDKQDGHTNIKIQWMTLEEAIKKSEKEPRKIFCGPIHRLVCMVCKNGKGDF